MNTSARNFVSVLALVVSLQAGYLTAGYADTESGDKSTETSSAESNLLTDSDRNQVLDAANHPSSPEHQSYFSKPMLPLDTTLSWKNRFLGDENFNPQTTLNQSQPMASDSVTKMSHSDAATDTDMSMQDMTSMDAKGTIKAIRANEGKLKIAHGEIKKHGMPAMTMMFKVNDKALLSGLEKGQEIAFSVDTSSGGFVITEIDNGNTKNAAQTDISQGQQSAGNLDARGVVKAVRASQGKVKIQHGPIERLGMPAMTMMFKVQNPALLEGIEKGGTVDFSVDSSSGGFVITHIKAAK